MTAVGVVICLCICMCLCAEFCQMSKNIDLYFSQWNKHVSVAPSLCDEEEMGHEQFTVRGLLLDATCANLLTQKDSKGLL